MDSKNALDRQTQIISEKIESSGGLRSLGRIINEDSSNLWRWYKGYTRISARATISMCRNFTDIDPHDLNPETFAEDVILIFRKKQ